MLKKGKKKTLQTRLNSEHQILGVTLYLSRWVTL